MAQPMSWSIVVPTVGRPCLQRLLDRIGEEVLLAAQPPEELVIVHDRPDEAPPELTLAPQLASRTRVVTGPGKGPAAARNVGWRSTQTDWVVFLDDDVVIGPQWSGALAADLDQPPDVGASQATLEVPLPADRAATDWERQYAGLALADWITADMAYRRSVLVEVAGFDERFPRAYREDTDLGIRVRSRGYRIQRGKRRTEHPVRPASTWISLSRQAGNADDALLRHLHGRRWRDKGHIPPGRRAAHVGLCIAGAAAAISAFAGYRRPARFAGLVWLAGTAQFAWSRISPGPRSPREIAAMTLTSAAIPPVAVTAWLAGYVRHRRARPWPAR